MYEKALELVISKTKNLAVKSRISQKKDELSNFCIENGIKL